jgi:replicative DNA helicase
VADEPGRGVAWDWPEPIPFLDEARPEFPTKHLPEVVRRFVDAVAVSTQTAPDVGALAALGIMSAAVAAKFVLRVRSDRVEYAMLWTASVLGSGERKSSVFAPMREPLLAWERETIAAQAEGLERDQSRARTLEYRLEAAERRAATAKGDDAQEAADERDDLAGQKARVHPKERFQLVIGDATQEATMSLLGAQGGRLALISDEAATFFAIATGRYAADGRANLDAYLQSYSAQAFRVNRNKRLIDVPRPSLVIVTTMQPSVLRDVAKRPELTDRGLLPRFLWGLPESLVGMRNPEPPVLSDDVRHAYDLLVRGMCGTPENRDADNQIVPAELALDPRGAALLRDLRIEVEKQLNPSGAFDHVREWANRIEGNAARVALVLHLAAEVQRDESGARQFGPVSRDAVADAVALAREYFIPHALAVFARMGTSAVVTNAQRLRDWIRRHGKPDFARRDVHRGNQTWAESAGDLDEPLRVLEDRGFIRRLDDERDGRIGRPTGPRWSVHPSLVRRDAPSVDGGGS